MHTIHYIATKSDNKTNAHSEVKQFLENQMGSEDNISSWYDWFVTGGGRWASGDDNQYNDDYVGDVAHQSEPAFREKLDQAHNWYNENLSQSIDEVRKINLTEMLDNIENNKEGLHKNFKLSFDLWPVNKLYNLISGDWGPDDHFYDTVNHTPHPTYMLEAIDKGDKDWYIVPVDFHF